jgi:hypothetical protein
MILARARICWNIGKIGARDGKKKQYYLGTIADDDMFGRELEVCDGNSHRTPFCELEGDRLVLNGVSWRTLR